MSLPLSLSSDASAERHTSRDWRRTLQGVGRAVVRDNLTIVAAGVAFYAFLALVPTLSSIISVWGFFADPARIGSHFGTLRRVLPPEAYQLVREQLVRVLATNPSTLGWGAIGSGLIALWSARQGTQAIIDATHIAFGTVDPRGYFKQVLISLGLTVGAVVVSVLTIAFAVLVPVVLSRVGLGGTSSTLIKYFRWPVLAGVVFSTVVALYRWVPDRQSTWREMIPGALLASLGWIGLSIGYSYFVTSFASYERTYGSLGAVVALMFWFWISAFIVLLGAELNSQLAREREDIAHPRGAAPSPRTYSASSSRQLE